MQEKNVVLMRKMFRKLENLFSKEEILPSFKSLLYGFISSGKVWLQTEGFLTITMHEKKSILN